MDLNQISIAQSQKQNQFHFDQDAFDKAVMRAEKQRTWLREARSKCYAVFAKIFDTLVAALKMVTRQRIA